MNTIQGLPFKHSRSKLSSLPVALHYEIAAINRGLPVLVHKPKHDMKIIIVEVLLGALAEFGHVALKDGLLGRHKHLAVGRDRDPYTKAVRVSSIALGKGRSCKFNPGWCYYSRYS